MAGANIKLTKEQQQYLIFAILILGGGGFSYFRYFWMPVSEKIATVQKKIDDLDNKIAKAKQQALKRESIQRELALLNEKAAEAEKRLPRQKDLPAVIDTLSELCQRYGIKLLTLSPGVMAPKTYFNEVPYSLTVNGSFHDIGRFFAAIALEERIFTVRNVSFGTPDAEGKLPVVFTLVSYQYKG